jgi:hypothetical protein
LAGGSACPTPLTGPTVYTSPLFCSRCLGGQFQRICCFAWERKWNATALVIDVDPLLLLLKGS